MSDFHPQREEYIARINRVIDYIHAHLDEDLDLRQLAGVAHFSPYHFHRLFRMIMGETLNAFVQRVRIEKAAAQLLFQPRKTITEIALDCGFSGSSAFARAFQGAYGVSASRWRAGEGGVGGKLGKTESKIGQVLRNKRKAFHITTSYIEGIITQTLWRIEMKSEKPIHAQVEIKTLPEMTVAYLRHVGPYQGDSQLFGKLFDKLFKWAGARGLLRFPETQVLSVYYDDPELTDHDKLRVDVCLTVPADTRTDGEIGKATLRGGRYAVARFELGSDQFQQAWDAVFVGWLPESGYQPDDGPCFELYHNNPDEHPDHKHIFDICVPVKPL
ncbi:AraC family transcriptional regulator [candidate division KSB1 bacterium]|nr:AraC family transcriptional regulator [candidate division KSB1 bacterium]